MKKLTWILPVLLSGIFEIAVAQLPDFSFRNYTIENGFPEGSILQIMQDKPGFIWCLADNALIKYDGNTFRTYRYDSEDSFSLPTSKVYNFGTGSNDLLLISYEKGICYYDLNIDGFKKLIPENFIKSAPSTHPFTKNNQIWFATQDKLLHQYDINSHKIKTFAACGSYIASIFIDSRNIVWVGTHEGLYRFYPQQNRYELYWQDTLNKVYGANMIRDIIEDEGNTIWFAGTNSGIYSMDPVARKVHFFDFKPVHWRKSKFYYLTNIISCTINRQPFILANSNDGLVFLNKSSGNYTLLRHDPRNPQSLLSNNIHDVMYDNYGTLWLATNQGVSKSERIMPGLKTVHIALLKNNLDNDDDENTGSELKSICHDPLDNTVWIGTASQGLWQYDLLKDSLIKKIPILNRELQTVEINELYADKAGRFWMGTPEGAGVYDPRIGKSIFLYENKNSADLFAKSDVSSNFMEDGFDNIWIGTADGVSIYNKQLQFIKNLKEEKGKTSKLQGHYIYALHSLNDHQVWVVTRTLNLYDSDSDSFVPELSKKFKNYTVSSFFEITDDERSNFYFTGYSGVYIWLKESGSFFFPLFNNFVNHDLGKSFVHKKKLWAATFGSGLLKIDLESNAITRFTIRNGLVTNSIKDLWWSQRNGPVFMITKDGFQYFHPDSVITNTQKAPLHITGINILGNPLKANYQLFTDSSLRISHKQDMISFEFSLLDYIFSEDITYQYKLDGFDKDWIFAGNHHSATYTNLDPGNYIFHVRAKNHDGIDAGETQLKLRVVPPFWKTGWFITSGVLILVFFLYRWYSYQQQKYQSEKILNSFTTSLYGQTTIEDMAWDIARNCISKLGFVDCIVYIFDDEKKVLVQKAACGPKNPVQREILNPIEISLGKGIVGFVAESGIAEIINDTSRDKRYLVDDMQRFSEISVPIVTDGTVFGIIDSEHPEKNFFTKQHLYLLKKISDVCSVRISKYIMEDRLRSKIARDLHDEMGSTLTSINIISKVALQQTEGNSIMKNNLQKIKDHSRHMMESMSDIVWAINPANDTLDKIILRMKEHAAEILEPAKINHYFREDGTLEDIKLNLGQRKDLYLIFKEALNNAVKYSEASEIHILLNRDNGYMKMQIMDNGKGFDIEKDNSGNGLRNMQSRAKQMQAKLKIHSIQGTGSTIILQVPIP